MISRSDFPLGSKSQPPFPPPIGKPVKAFLKICSKPKNLMILRSTEGCNRKPPLYGPIALLNWTRYALLTCVWAASSTQATRKSICRSGVVKRSKIACLRYFSSSRSITGRSDPKTSSTACLNSACSGFCFATRAKTSSTYPISYPYY